MSRKFSAARLLLLSLLSLPLLAAPILDRSSDRASDGVAVLASAESAPGPAQAAVTYRQFVRFWVHGDSVYPDVVRIKPGSVLLRVENQTTADITLYLERVVAGAAPQLLGQASTVNRAYRADLKITLQAGEYEVYEVSQPAYRARLIVEPL